MNPRNTLDILVAARKLIEDPKHWTIGKFSRVGPQGNMRFCARGAVRQVGDGAGVARWALEGAAATLYGADIVRVNDGPLPYERATSKVPKTRTARHKAVLRVFDHAIAKLGGPLA